MQWKKLIGLNIPLYEISCREINKLDRRGQHCELSTTTNKNKPCSSNKKMVLKIGRNQIDPKSLRGLEGYFRNLLFVDFF